MPISRCVPSWVRRFARDERGVMTIHNLFLTLTCCAIGAVGLDVTHFYAARTQLQVAADTAAHAALYTRLNGRTADQAKAAAVSVASYAMPAATYGTVLEQSDIVFGTWDAATSRVVPPPSGSTALPTAVQVTTNRAGTDNAVGSFLFRVVGIRQMDVRASAVYIADGDPCARMQGMFAIGPVTPNGDNWFVSNICVHSQTAVNIKNDPKFRDGSRVSAPDMGDLSCSNNCGEFNDARRTASYNLNQWLDPIRPPPPGVTETPRDLLDDVRAALPNWNWNGINQTISTASAADVGDPSKVNGRVSYYRCASSNGKAGRVELSGPYSKAVLILDNCEVVIKKKSDVTLSDTIIYTTATDEKNTFHIDGSGFTVGTDPNCTGSGVAALLTRGGIDTPSKTSFQNGIVRALGGLQFAAQFGRTDESSKSVGVSMIAQGTINPQSNNTFRGCPPDPNAPPQLMSFRLAL